MHFSRIISSAKWPRQDTMCILLHANSTTNNLPLE
uniref:Uncharacterized protein n=1 Tax=Setaria italica TaxID=4555 RepID=K3YNP2_SETIT